MSNWFSKIIGWLIGLWSSLPEETKEKIINAIVDTFEEMLSAFYKASKQDSRV